MTEPSTATPVAERTNGFNNGFAVAALVCGIGGFCGLGILLSLVLGCTALWQIHRTGQRGKGLAIAGMAIAVGWAVVLAGPVTRYLTTRNPPPPAAIHVGDCVVGLAGDTAPVPCDRPHESEVFGRFTMLGGSRYPSADEVGGLADSQCDPLFDDYVSVANRSAPVEFVYRYPSEYEWRDGVNTIFCIATDPAGSTTGSLRG